MGRTAADPLERWWAKVDCRAPEECWPWTAARFEGGYGAFRLGNRQLKAHRFGYSALIGEIPVGIYVLHSCDNPPCCNPRHWFLGTHRDNALDRERKGRGRYRTVGPLTYVKPGRARGERSGQARLTDGKVRLIRKRYSMGESQQSIADNIGVSQGAVSCVIRGSTWGHVTD